MATFPAASEAANPPAHTEKTHLSCESLSCHFRGPISSVKLQTNFLGMPFKMIHPHFQSIFPISYWDLSLFVAEGRFSVRTASLLWSPLLWFLFRLSEGDQIVWNLWMTHLFSSRPSLRTPRYTIHFQTMCFLCHSSGGYTDFKSLPHKSGSSSRQLQKRISGFGGRAKMWPRGTLPSPMCFRVLTWTVDTQVSVMHGLSFPL